VTEFELVRKKLSLIETCVRELREMARPDEIQTDLFQQRFSERTLLIANCRSHREIADPVSRIEISSRERRFSQPH